MILERMKTGTGNLLQEHWGVGGIMVSIAAFQAVDPGSIPGRRNFVFSFYLKKKIIPLPGIEPGPPGWEPGILTTRP